MTDFFDPDDFPESQGGKQPTGFIDPDSVLPTTSEPTEPSPEEQRALDLIEKETQDKGLLAQAADVAQGFNEVFEKPVRGILRAGTGIPGFGRAVTLGAQSQSEFAKGLKNLTIVEEIRGEISRQRNPGLVNIGKKTGLFTGLSVGGTGLARGLLALTPSRIAARFVGKVIKNLPKN